MAERIRRTHEQRQAELERKLQRVKSERKKMEEARQTRRAIIIGKTIQSMADSGDAEAKLMVDRILAGLKRDQDRKAFDLEPLPEPRPEPDNQPEPGLLVIAQARRQRAVEAWKGSDQSAEFQSELVNAVIGEEKLTGECWSGIKDRSRYGLSDRPGELARPR